MQLRSRLDGLRRGLQRLVHLLVRNACLNSSLQTPPGAAVAWKGILPQSPAARGELLVGALTETSERDGAGASSMLACLEQRFGLGQSVSAAVTEVRQQHLSSRASSSLPVYLLQAVHQEALLSRAQCQSHSQQRRNRYFQGWISFVCQ